MMTMMAFSTPVNYLLIVSKVKLQNKLYIFTVFSDMLCISSCKTKSWQNLEYSQLRVSSLNVFKLILSNHIEDDDDDGDGIPDDEEDDDGDGLTNEGNSLQMDKDYNVITKMMMMMMVMAYLMGMRMMMEMALKMMKILMMMATAFLMKMMSFKFDCIEMYSYIDEIDNF